MLRRWWTSLNAAATASPEDDLELGRSTCRNGGPLRLRGRAEPIGVSILNLTVTHGKGAPAHPSTQLAVVGLAASIALIAVVRTHHRFIVGSPPSSPPFAPSRRCPTRCARPPAGAVIPVVYAFLLTQRQRKATTARTGRAVRADAGEGDGPGDAGTAGRWAAAARRAGARPPQTGPQANRRYTPPKAKRAARASHGRPSSAGGHARRPARAPPGSRADRRKASSSARRRTSERAVGSTPRARSTSTSVATPITVE